MYEAVISDFLKLDGIARDRNGFQTKRIVHINDDAALLAKCHRVQYSLRQIINDTHFCSVIGFGAHIWGKQNRRQTNDTHSIHPEQQVSEMRKKDSRRWKLDSPNKIKHEHVFLGYRFIYLSMCMRVYV